MSAAPRPHDAVTSANERRQTGSGAVTRFPFSAARIIDRLVGHGWRWSFRRRRAVSVLIVAGAIAAMIVVLRWADAAFLRPSLITGWTLMACLIGLTLIGVRRRLPVLPLGRVASWTQVHVYSGLFAIGVFVLHAPAMLADGILERGLSVLFWFVSGSGVYGLIASRRLPPKLTAIGGDDRFDQIPWRREQIATAAVDQVESLAGEPNVRVLGEFYDRYLRQYFRDRPSVWTVLMPRVTRRRRLTHGLMELDRYLDEEGRVVTGRLVALVRRRDELDYQTALQWRLRGWVIVHATASIALVVTGIIHGILALRFLGA